MMKQGAPNEEAGRSEPGKGGPTSTGCGPEKVEVAEKFKNYWIHLLKSLIIWSSDSDRYIHRGGNGVKSLSRQAKNGRRGITEFSPIGLYRIEKVPRACTRVL